MLMMATQTCLCEARPHGAVATPRPPRRGRREIGGEGVTAARSQPPSHPGVGTVGRYVVFTWPARSRCQQRQRCRHYQPSEDSSQNSSLCYRQVFSVTHCFLVYLYLSPILSSYPSIHLGYYMSLLSFCIWSVPSFACLFVCMFVCTYFSDCQKT